MQKKRKLETKWEGMAGLWRFYDVNENRQSSSIAEL